MLEVETHVNYSYEDEPHWRPGPAVWPEPGRKKQKMTPAIKYVLGILTITLFFAIIALAMP